MISFKEILQEASFDFGKYLFGELVNYYKKVVEPNTPKENEIYTEITKFIYGNYDYKNKPKSLIDALNILNDLKSKFPKELKPETNLLYRGLQFNTKELLNHKYNRVEKSSSKYWQCEDEIKIEEKSDIQSWTTDFKTAAKFANPQEIKNGYSGIVLEHKFSDNELIFNSDFLNAIARQVIFSAEDEIIRFTKTPISCKVYLIKYKIEQFDKNLNG